MAELVAVFLIFCCTLMPGLLFADEEADIEFAKFGSDLEVKCKDERNTSFKIWEEDGFPVDKESLKYRENKDGNLIIKDIDLDDAWRKISCRLFFTMDDLIMYKKNKQVVPYRTAIIVMPVLVYRTVQKSDSTCTVETASWKDLTSSTICHTKYETRKGHCEQFVANSSLELDRESNFMVLVDKKNFLLDSCKDELREPADSQAGKLRGAECVAPVVIAVVGLGALVGTVELVLCLRRNQKCCWKGKKSSSSNIDAEEQTEPMLTTSDKDEEKKAINKNDGDKKFTCPCFRKTGEEKDEKNQTDEEKKTVNKKDRGQKFACPCFRKTGEEKDEEKTINEKDRDQRFNCPCFRKTGEEKDEEKTINEKDRDQRFNCPCFRKTGEEKDEKEKAINENDRDQRFTCSCFRKTGEEKTGMIPPPKPKRSNTGGDEGPHYAVSKIPDLESMNFNKIEYAEVELRIEN